MPKAQKEGGKGGKGAHNFMSETKSWIVQERGGLYALARPRPVRKKGRGRAAKREDEVWSMVFN